MCKIAVYTLCRNEESNIKEWLENVKNADFIIVGDTGSTDNSIKILENNDVIVHRLNISPWRFDVARNELLRKIPKEADICISLDFDERLSDNWRELIEKNWNPSINRISYNYVLKDLNTKNISVSIIASKIHSRLGYAWKYPVHEILYYNEEGKEKSIHLPSLTIIHSPCPTKDRNQYLDLLKLAVKENPNIFNLRYQLAKDYINQGLSDLAIKTLELFSVKDISKEQKNALEVLKSRAYYNLNNYNKAKNILCKLIKKHFNCSAHYIELAIMAYKEKDWDGLMQLGEKCQHISFKEISRYNDYQYDEYLLYDIISMSYYSKGKYSDALYFAKKALTLKPSDKRIMDNVNCFQKLVRKANTLK